VIEGGGTKLPHEESRRATRLREFMATLYYSVHSYVRCTWAEHRASLREVTKHTKSRFVPGNSQILNGQVVNQRDITRRNAARATVQRCVSLCRH